MGKWDDDHYWNHFDRPPINPEGGEKAAGL